MNVYDSREAANITDWVLENVTGLRKIDRVVNKTSRLPAAQKERLEQITTDLLKHRPVQYALGEAWFHGMKFFVNESVLIPRPETEELVEWIIHDAGKDTGGLLILDIGSGSGCIPIALKTKLPSAIIESCDVNSDALAVAEKNAKELNAAIQFHLLNFLNQEECEKLGMYNVIVSNPPYIPTSEQSEMEKHVVAFEPHLALFVENEDPLIFYKAILQFSTLHLFSGGSIYVETHMNLADEVAQLFKNEAFDSVEIRKDMQGRNRMVKAVKHT